MAKKKKNTTDLVKVLSKRTKVDKDGWVEQYPYITDKEFVNYINDYLGDKDRLISMPIGPEQVNAVILVDVLLSQSRKFRKEYFKGYVHEII